MNSCRPWRCGPSVPPREIASKKDRFSQPKNSPNTDHARWRNRVRNTAKIGASVTTRHLFWPNRRRKAAASLRFRLPNLDFQVREQRQGGRGSAAAIRPEASIQNRSRNFMPNKRTSQFA
jgi:hypothetical protein